ncbi:MAG TPA: ribose-phosphate diphosphokinase [Burkholderiaceae bacterium]|nr:ribose-phosphate diphosphokinase [Burkholderiaceae bacterium]HQR71053.1 ribose-phosphate diphosphokinase [Burkholderiaceae bacterium]
MLLFALAATRDFGAAIARELGQALAPLEERTFEDGEHKIRPLTDPDGADVYVVQSLHGGPDASGDDKLVRLLMFSAALRDHGARRITAVTPYLAYARKDRRTKPFDPVSLRVVAQLIEAAGCDGLITLEAHNVAAFDNAFRRRAVNLDPYSLFTAAAAPAVGDAPVVVASPDIGGVKRVQLWRELLEAAWQRPIGQAFVDKRRSAGVVSSGEIVTGDVNGATVLILDDLIATFGTIERAARALTKAGARRILAFAAHGLFVGPAAESVERAPVERVFVTDTVPPFRLTAAAARGRVEVLPSAALFAAEIRRQHAAWR